MQKMEKEERIYQGIKYSVYELDDHLKIIIREEQNLEITEKPPITIQ